MVYDSTLVGGILVDFWRMVIGCLKSKIHSGYLHVLFEPFFEPVLEFVGVLQIKSKNSHKQITISEMINDNTEQLKLSYSNLD